MADLKTIMRINRDELKRQLPVEEAVSQAMSALNPREGDVLARRHGLRGSDCQTLQQIGEGFGITRERVRQIEAQGLKKFRMQLTKPPLADIAALIVSAILEQGGVVARDVMSEEFLPHAQRTPKGRHALSFLISQLPDLVLQPETKHLLAIYARSAAHARAVAQIEPAAVKILNDAKSPMPTGHILQELRQSEAATGISYLLDKPFLEASLEIGKRFVSTPDARWGLASWSDINPRNIREKTLFIMKKGGTPLHFTEITRKISDARFDNKRVTVQAVHNELINGSEFILIGRGIYALKDWGYVPGTVSDVIQEILRKAVAPMDREDIIEQVLKQRHVSRNTILINLQEKNLFNRVDKRRYALATANSAAIKSAAKARVPAPRN